MESKRVIATYSDLHITSQPKPVEKQYSAAFVDEDSVYRDYNIENMFNELFLGELSQETRHNFKQFYTLLVGFTDSVPDDVFGNVTNSVSWISSMFGPICVSSIQPSDKRDPDFNHCTHMASLVPHSHLAELFEPVVTYAPNAICASLLTVVVVYRFLAARFLEQKFATTGMMH